MSEANQINPTTMETKEENKSKKNQEIYIGTLISADFEEGTMEFEIETEFIVKSGKYAIVPIENHDQNASLKEQNKRLREFVLKFILCQKENYGNATNTHLKMSTLKNEAEQLLSQTEE